MAAAAAASRLTAGRPGGASPSRGVLAGSPEAGRARAAAYVITATEGAALHLDRLRTHADDFDPAVRSIFDFRFEHVRLTGYDPHPHIKAKVAV